MCTVSQVIKACVVTSVVASEYRVVYLDMAVQNASHVSPGLVHGLF